MFKTILKSSSAIPNVFGKTLKNRDGVAAIEFAIIAPIMVVMYLGLAELSLLVTADRNVSHASAVTADLSTQTETLEGADIEDIFDASLAVLGADYTNASRFSVDITSFEVDADDVIQEVGYAKLGTGFTDKVDPEPIKTNSPALLNQTSGLVVTRVMYEYHSPSQRYVGTPILTETFMLKPRKSAIVEFVEGGGHTVTCTVTNDNGFPRASC